MISKRMVGVAIATATISPTMIPMTRLFCFFLGCGSCVCGTCGCGVA